MKIKNKSILMGVGIVCLLLAGPCLAADKNGRYTSRAVAQTERFHAISVQGNIEVNFVQAPQTSVYISGKEKHAAGVKTRVEEGVLYLSRANGLGREVHVSVSAPDLTRVTLAQQGEFNVRGALQVTKFDVLLSGGSGFSADRVKAQHINIFAQDRAEVEMERLDAEQVKAAASGRANIDLSGLAQEIHFENSGSGDIDADDLRAPRGEAVVKGKGDISISAYEALNATVLGKGKIKYKGVPVSLQTSGNTQRIMQELDD